MRECVLQRTTASNRRSRSVGSEPRPLRTRGPESASTPRGLLLLLMSASELRHSPQGQNDAGSRIHIGPRGFLEPESESLCTRRTEVTLVVRRPYEDGSGVAANVLGAPSLGPVDAETPIHPVRTTGQQSGKSETTDSASRGSKRSHSGWTGTRASVRPQGTSVRTTRQTADALKSSCYAAFTVRTISSRSRMRRCFDPASIHRIMHVRGPLSRRIPKTSQTRPLADRPAPMSSWPAALTLMPPPPHRRGLELTRSDAHLVISLRGRWQPASPRLRTLNTHGWAHPVKLSRQCRG